MKNLLKADEKIFIENLMMNNACLKQLEIIGEAANHLSDELHNDTDNIEWGRIIVLRNLIAHEYFGISLPII